MRSSTAEQGKWLESETVPDGQSETQRSLMIGAWLVKKVKKKYIPVAYDINGVPEYANIEFDNAYDAQRFCDEACEMYKRGVEAEERMLAEKKREKKRRKKAWNLMS